MPVPAGMKELVSDGDVSHARAQGLLSAGAALLDAGAPTTGVAPTFGQALSRGLQAGMGGYQSALEGTVSRNLAAEEIARQRARQAQHDALSRRFGARPGETPEQAMQRVIQLYPDLVLSGHPLAQSVAQAIPSMVQQMGAQSPELAAVNLGDRVAMVDPRTGQVVQEYRVGERPGANDGSNQRQTFTMERQLRRDFDSEVKTYKEGYFKLTNALEEAPKALAGDGAAQTAILYAFVTAMDPATAVREGEIALVQAAASLRARAQQYLSKVDANGNISTLVPRQLISQMADLLRRRQAQFAENINEAADFYGQIAESYGLNPNMFRRVPTATPAATGVTPAPVTGTQYDGVDVNSADIVRRALGEEGKPAFLRTHVVPDSGSANPMMFRRGSLASDPLMLNLGGKR